MSNQNVIVLHSGGIDSTALIHFYGKQGYHITPVFIKYGQISAQKEWQSVKKIAKYYSLNPQKINVDLFDTFEDGFVQGRNLFFLSIALLHFKTSVGQVAIGVHTGTNYIDCSKQFIDKCNDIFSLYTGGSIVVSAPLVNWTKKQIFDYCAVEKIPIQYTYSCELGKHQPCGECSSCKELIALYETKNK